MADREERTANGGADNDENDANKSIANATWMIFLATVANIGVAVLSWSVLYSTDQSIRDQNTLTHPPRIIVPLIVAYPEGQRGQPIGAFVPDKVLDGFARAINHGHERADVIRERCATYWHIGALPMARPYDMFDGGVAVPDVDHVRQCSPLLGDHNDIMLVMQPGNEATWNFKTTVPKDYSANMSLYVIGYVHYRDRLGFYQYTLFARRYDPDTRVSRFVPVKDNAAYEYEN